MGSTTDPKPPAALDLHTEIPLSELALSPEQRTPEVRALYEKAMLEGQTEFTPTQEEIIRTQGPVVRSGTPVTDAFRAWLKTATPEQLQQFANAGNALAAGLRAASKPDAGPGPEITYDQFKSVEIVIGKIIAAKPVPKTDKLVHLVVDLGGSRNAVDVLAGIQKSFPDPTVLLGRTFAFVANLPPRPMRGVVSRAMLLAATSDTDPEKVIPVECVGAQVGARIS